MNRAEANYKEWREKEDNRLREQQIKCAKETVESLASQEMNEKNRALLARAKQHMRGMVSSYEIIKAESDERIRRNSEMKYMDHQIDFGEVIKEIYGI